MNAKFTGLGAEPKKLAALGLLVAAGAYFYFSNSSSPGTTSNSTTPATRVTTASTPMAPAPLQRRTAQTRRREGGANIAEFRPSLKPNKDLDRASIDPTLRLDLLERLQNVKVEGISRSLFEALSAPPPSPTALAKVQEPAKIIPFVPYGPPAPQKEVAAAPPPKPPAPPIPLKFYGFISPVKSGTGAKRAFFLDGEDIIVAAEGQVIKNRYKIVRIGLNSAVVADTQFENHEQTLPLVEEQQG